MVLPPLALYIHIPWCVRKCPYCDFNSHAVRDGVPETAYVDRLLRDLEQETAALPIARTLTSIFIGGGTPSLFSGAAIARLLNGVRDLIELSPHAEITLEANPGTADAGHFATYREAGINRLSIGAQSLSASHLERLGRIHGPADIHSALALARQAGFANINLDLMYGLPKQSLTQAQQDLAEALTLAPAHLSYYQLTLEPNTAFHRTPPDLPEADLVADMQLQGIQMLKAAGFEQYEVSAYAQQGHRCRHNLNYWEFGDYIGIGAGAHGKLSDPAGNRVERTWKLRHPMAYLAPQNADHLTAGRRMLSASDLILELAMNSLRQPGGFDPKRFELHAGTPLGDVTANIDMACAAGLLIRTADNIRPTELGHRFLDDLLQYFDQC